MAYQKLERKEAKTMTMGKDGFDVCEGILVHARTRIGRYDNALYTFRTKAGALKVWGNKSINEQLLDETGGSLVKGALGHLVKIEVTEMVPIGEGDATVAECDVSVDTTARQLPGKETKKK